MTKKEGFTSDLDYLEVRLEVVLPPKALNPEVSIDTMKLSYKELEYVNEYLRNGQVAEIVAFALREASYKIINKVKEVERGSER